MLYVGIDVHLKRSSIHVLDENGKQVHADTIRGSRIKVLAELEKVKEKFGEKMAVCFESSCGAGWFHDQLAAIVERVVVAHPGQLRMIFRAKRKNDRVDAKKLATLLFLDQVPPVYVPKPEVRAWRELIEHRQGLIRKRVRVKNELRALLRTQGMEGPRGLWTKAGRAWLRAAGLPNELTALKRDILTDELEALGPQTRRVEKALAETAKRYPAVTLLRTIPGVGIRTAEAVVAYIDNPRRFTKTERIGSYFGVVPCQNESAGKNRLGHITKQGPGTVRKLVAEAAWVSIRRSPRIRAFFERVMHGKKERKKIALVATAHHLLRVMLGMLKTGETWREVA